MDNSSTVAPIDNEQSANDVKERCWDQREALPGEPRCIICGRYGEYICDITDDDICSLECKQILLSKLAKSQKPVAHAPPVRLPATDNCFYVRENSEKSGSKDQNPDQNPDQTEMLRKKLEICVSGDCVPEPALSFASCNLPHKLLNNIENAGYEIPTPVQMQAIPAAMFGKNLLVSAETGSGKTASYLIPIISHCSNFDYKKFPNKPLAIVLTPTRELCVQVEEQAKLLGKGLPFKTALVVGGDPIAGQIYRIKQNVEMIVGTPGRIIDLLTKYDVALDCVSILVLDEVDCMLQRGFRDQVMQIFRALSQPQVLMYSATIPKEVEKMANLMVKDIISVSVANKPNGAVRQLPIWVESKKKKQKLFEILMSVKHFRPPAVVFVGSRVGADLLSEAITVTTGMKSFSIHGEKSMKERREIIKSFLVGEVPVVVATGVLGRGIVLLRVKQVIIFDMPNSIEEYIHQIGRVSRIGEEGSVFVFINDEDKRCFTELVDLLKLSGSPIPKELLNSRYTCGTSSLANSQKKRKHWG